MKGRSTGLLFDDAELLHGDDPVFVFMERSALAEEATRWYQALAALERPAGTSLTRDLRAELAEAFDQLLPPNEPPHAELSALCERVLPPQSRSAFSGLMSNHLYFLRHSKLRGPGRHPMKLFACPPMWKRRWVRAIQDGFYPVWARWSYGPGQPEH